MNSYSITLTDIQDEVCLAQCQVSLCSMMGVVLIHTGCQIHTPVLPVIIDEIKHGTRVHNCAIVDEVINRQTNGLARKINN